MRDLSIDVIKIVAMFSVILLHTSVSFESLDSYIIANTMKTCGLMAVPLFFMVSGYLMLGKKDISYRYVFRKIYSILRYVICFSFLYWLIFSIKNWDFNIISLIKGSFLSLFNRGFFPWFWYFGAISIIYFLLPILNYIYVKDFNGGGNMLIGTLLITQFLIFQYAANIHMDNMGINITFKIYNWLTFFWIGGIIKHYNLKSRNWFFLVLLLIVNIFFQNLEKGYLPQTEFLYASLPLLLLVITIFTFIKSLEYSLDNKWIKELSKLFLLVYSIHLIIMKYIPNHLFGENIFSPLLYFIVISVISVGCSSILVRIPYLNKILTL